MITTMIGIIGAFLWGTASAFIFPYPWSILSSAVGGVAIGVLTIAYGAP